MLLCELEPCLRPLSTFTSKGCSETGAFGFSSSTYFWINNSRNNEGMKVIFLKKRSKFYVDFKNAIKVSENVFGFEDNCDGTCCRNFWLLWKEYMWSALNVLKKGPSILDSTKRHDTQLTLFDFNRKLV